MSANTPLYRVFWLSSVTDLTPWQDKLMSFFADVKGHNRFAQWTQLLFYLNQFDTSQTLRLCLITTPHYAIQGVLLLKQNHAHSLLARMVPTLDCLGNQPHITDVNELLIHSYAAELIPIMANALINAPFKWTRLHWQFMQPEPHIRALMVALEPFVHKACLTDDLPRPVLSLPATEADYIKQRSSRVKKFVNNKQNRLGRDFPDQSPRLVWVAPEDTPGIMDWFFPTYLAYWDKQHVKTEFHRHPALIPFYRQCLAQGLLKLTGYFVGDEVACVFVGYDLPDDTYLLHLTCFNPKYADYSPGILHNDALIKSLIEKQVKTLDFGLGDLEYKSYFTKTKLPTWQLIVHRTGFSYGVYAVLDRAKAWVKSLLKPKKAASDKPVMVNESPAMDAPSNPG